MSQNFVLETEHFKMIYCSNSEYFFLFFAGLVIIICFFSYLVTGWVILVKSISPLPLPNVKSLMLLFRGHTLQYAHTHPEMTVQLARLSLIISFPDHTQLLSSTNCWAMALLFLTMPLGTNSFTNECNQIWEPCSYSSQGQRFVLIPRSLPDISSPISLQKTSCPTH